MAIRDVTYTNDVCRLELRKAFGDATGGTTRLAGTPSTNMESNFGSAVNVDFATTKSLDPRLIFTRASTATYFDSNGYLTSAAVNQPRFNHDPYTKRSLGIWCEGDGTNDYSGNSASGAIGTFSTTGGITQTSGTVTDPRNISNTLTRFTVSTATAQHFGTYTIFNSSENRIASVFFKLNTGTIYPVLIIDNGGGNGVWVSFDLSTGVIIQTGTNGISTFREAGIQKLPNGWCRCWISASKGAGGNWARVGITSTNTTTGSQWYPSYTATVGDSFWMYGLQLEHSASNHTTPTSFMLGTTTRSKDICYMPATNFHSSFNNREGTFFAEWNHPLQESSYGVQTIGGVFSLAPIVGAVDTGSTSALTDANYDTVVFCIQNTNSTQNSIFYRTRTENFQTQTSMSQNSTRVNKIAFTYSSVEQRRYVSDSGGLPTIPPSIQLSASPFNMAAAQLLIGGENNSSNTNVSGLCISNVKYYPRSFGLSTESLRSLTVAREF